MPILINFFLLETDNLSNVSFENGSFSKHVLDATLNFLIPISSRKSILSAKKTLQKNSILYFFAIFFIFFAFSNVNSELEISFQLGCDFFIDH